MRKNLFSAFLKRGLPIGILLFVTLACVNSGSEIGKQEPAQPAAKSTAKTVAAVIDIPKLIRQPPPEFEKLFGKATEVSKTNDPGTVPGEIHDYVLEGSGNYSTANGIMVRFFKNKAVMIMVDLPSPAPNAADALMQGRIDVKGSAPTVQAPMAHRWRNKTFNGISFKDVAAHKLDSNGKNFTTVQAEVDQ